MCDSRERGSYPLKKFWFVNGGRCCSSHCMRFGVTIIRQCHLIGKSIRERVSESEIENEKGHMKFTSRMPNHLYITIVLCGYLTFRYHI